jgi:transposase
MVAQRSLRAPIYLDEAISKRATRLPRGVYLGQEPMLTYLHEQTTNGFTEGCHTKIKMLKGVSYSLRNGDVYWRKMLLEFVSSRGSFHTI